MRLAWCLTFASFQGLLPLVRAEYWMGDIARTSWDRFAEQKIMTMAKIFADKGLAVYAPGGSGYSVFRNVKDYGAKG
jgi:hypothetical protein